MSNVNLPSYLTSSPKGKANANNNQREYTRYEHDKDGKRWARQGHADRTYSKMHGYASSGSASETTYNRRYNAKHHPSPLAEKHRDDYGSDSRHYDDMYSNASFEDNAAADLSAPAAVPVQSKISPNDTKSWSVRTERGLTHGVTLMFSGAPVHFAAQSAPRRPNVHADKKSLGEASTFDPTKTDLCPKMLKTCLRSAAKANELSSVVAAGVAQNAARNNAVVPLGIHIGSYHNPFSFPVGVKSKHEALNQTVTRSNEKFMVVLLPGTHNADHHINLRDNLDQARLVNAARLNEVDPASCMMQPTAGSPYVAVVKGSMLHSGIETAVDKGQCVPVEWNKTKDIEVNGQNYVDRIPRAAAEYAIAQIHKRSKQNHGSIPLKELSFSIHPLNYEEKWDGHHLSGAEYDKTMDADAYVDFLNRPANITVNSTLEYL